MAAAVAVTPWGSPGKEDGHISKTSGKLASPDGVDQVLDFEEFEAAPSTHNVLACSLNSFERTAKSRLDEILSEDEDDKSPFTGADWIRLAAIMVEPDDDSLIRYMYSDVPGLAEPKDPLRPKTRDETYAKVRSILDAHLVYDQLDPEIATESSLVEFSGIVALEIVTMAMLFEPVDSVEELIPWLVVVKLEIGKIKKRRYMKRGDGTRRHGRPPDLTLGGSFGHIESWNMGVYPGRGPALISRADMIILPPTTPPPSRTPPPATTTFCPPRADEGVAGPVDVLKGLPRNLFVALSGLSAAGNASPPTANSGIPKSSELSVSNPANPSS